MGAQSAFRHAGAQDAALQCGGWQSGEGWIGALIALDCWSSGWVLLRVVVTISNVAASAVAAVNEPVTQRTGLFMLAAFCGERDENDLLAAAPPLRSGRQRQVRVDRQQREGHHQAYRQRDCQGCGNRMSQS